MCFADGNKPRSGGEATSELQKQTQDANMTALTSTISKLQQEKDQLQKEKAELLAKLATTKGTRLHICIYCVGTFSYLITGALL